VSIGRGCENPLIVAHEIGEFFTVSLFFYKLLSIIINSKLITTIFSCHSLGFFHEQSRYDRDKYIRIDSQNIHSGFYNQFTKQQPDMLQTYDVEYDIGWFFSLAAFVLKNSTDPLTK
jgi:hypothetical protein